MQNQVSEYLAWIVRQEKKDRRFVRCPVLRNEAPQDVREYRAQRYLEETREVTR